ncbi:hypothetical protein IV203_012895 [Nitzschia inconspicua]|uniref:Uncharacterized protein n=1 Tax=Nitzschia inconspicua TaxID=303405 RepID=A0A9K3M5X7_9STRA|nr:hypothetical protein IV203_012895 [Nitzschia inconspicua]
MGGGTSRLDETDWEIADGQITSVDQTVDGDAPTSKYQLYEIRKQSVGQRAFDVVDAQHNVLLTTQGVSGTLSWFDVLGPKSIGEYKDLKLRVQSDMSRRTWIVYRYHTPVFQGQKAANDVDNCDSSSSSTANADVLFKGVEPGVKLYKTACITVSWSRYVAVAARYGPPSADDFLNLDIHDMMMDPEDGNDATTTIPATTSFHSNNGDNIVAASSQGHVASSSSSNVVVTDDDPLFSVAKQIAARSRERTTTTTTTATATTTTTTSTTICSNDDADDYGTDTKDNDGGDRDQTTQHEMETTLQDSKSYESNKDSVSALNIDTATSIDAARSVDVLSPASSNQPSRAVATSSTASPPKRNTGPKRPVTTLTELAASHGTSTTFRRSTAVGTQTIRDYFTKSTTTSNGTNSTAPVSSRFGSRLFKRNSSSVDNNSTTEENVDDDPSIHASDMEYRTNNNKNNYNNEPSTPRQLYELALEGVIDLDTQPIVQCQEISCKLLGNHQTFNMTKEQLFQLLRLDEKQHDEETHQQQQEQEQNERAPQGETDEEQQKQEDSANPMVQAMKLDVAHQKQQGEADGARSSRWISSIRNFRARGGVTKTESKDIAAATSTDETLESKENGDDINQSASSSSLNGSSPNQGRLRSSFHRLFSSTSAEEVTDSSPNDDMVLSVETSSIQSATKTQETSVTDGETPFNAVVGDNFDRDNLPSLLDESVSSSQQLSDNGNGDVVDQFPLTETAETKTPESSQSPSPGSGVEESKVEAPETPQNVATNSAAATNTIESVSTEETENPASRETNEATPPVDDHPHPLVGYWFWKHTTFHFGQHKMFLHLAKNSDLALHLILSIIVNQVRSERNHTIFATTGLHPALFFIDPRNPKAMIT